MSHDLIKKGARWFKTERGWVILVSLVVVFITSLPFLSAWLWTPANWEYTGQMLSPADGNTYLNKMKQGADGQWLFSIDYTSEPHSPVFLHPYYLALGHLTHLLGIPLEWMFQISRAVNSVLLLVVLYIFIGQFQEEVMQRRQTFLLVVLSSGFGWLLVLINIPSTDISTPESITFTTLLTNPHFPLSTAFILLSLLLGQRMFHKQSLGYAMLCGVSQVVLIFIHPYDIVITSFVLGGYFLLGWWIRRWWSWQAIRYLIVCYLICLPAILYNVSLYLGDGVWHLWQTQSPPPLPPAIAFVSGYGVLLPLALLGGVKVWRGGCQSVANSYAILLVIWAVGIPVIMFLPFPLLKAIQVRFSEGLHIPVAILASFGLALVLKRFKRIHWTPVVVILSLSNLLVLFSILIRLRAPESPWFYTHDEVAVMRWLDEHSQPDDVVLSLDWSGNYLPAVANVHVYVGHLYETIDYQTKAASSEAFFAEKLTDPEDREFLLTNHIIWVFMGEQEVASAFNPQTKPWLIPRFSQGHDAVYEVKLP